MKLARAILALAVVIFLLASANPLALHTAGFAPKTGDSFHYYEVQTTGNGTGYYAGYTDQTILNGVEQITGVNGDNVSASYNYSYSFTSNEASSTSGSQSGVFSFDSSSFLYGSQTDGQVGYVNPTVWFAMNNNLSVGSTFNILNTQMTISSKNFSLFVPTLSEDISTISGVGSGSYTGSPGNDEGGIYNVTYVWNVYFDPNSGYIVGYNYFESDTNSSATFTWSDNLYVTQTTYPLTVLAVVTTTTAPTSTSAVVSSSTSNASAGITPYLGYIAAFIILILIIAIIAFAASRRNRRTLPSHPYRQTPPPSAPPPGIDLTPKEQPPVQQVVIKEVAKVQCQYCGALMDSTATVCPRCGAPRT